MSQQQQATNENILLECLGGLLSPEHNKAAEQKLNELSTTMPLYASMLCQLATNGNAQVDIRQLSLIVLKKFIKEHWHEMANTQEKEHIKSLLNPCLSDSSSKIRTAVAMCIGRIGCVEWPNHWPSLLDDLLKCLIPPLSENRNLLSGALKTLEILCDPSYLDKSQMQQIIVMLFPIFQKILATYGTDQHILETHSTIINIFKSVLSFNTLTAEFSKLISPTVGQWLEVLVKILSAPINNAIHPSVIEILTLLKTTFPKQITPYLQTLLAPLWAVFIQSQPLYEKTLYDMDEENVDSLIMSLIDFLTIIITPKTKALFQPHLSQIIKVTLTYLQLSDDMADLYQSEPSQYLEQNDETSYNPRTLASTFLVALSDIYKQETLALLYQALQSFNGNWRQQEASLQAMSLLAEKFIKAGDGKFFDFTQFLKQLSGFFEMKTEHSDIIQGRALHCACIYSAAVDKSIALQFLKLSVTILSDPNQPLPNKMASMKAISAFDKANLIEHIPVILQCTMALLSQVDEDCLLCVLDTIVMALRADKSADLSRYEPLIVPSLLQCWTKHANDPLAADTINDIFQLLTKSAGSYPAIIEHVLPTLCIVIENFDKSAYLGISDRAISLLNLVLSNYTTQFETTLLDRALAPLINIVLSESPVEKNTLIAAICSLPVFVKRGHHLLAQWTYRNISGLNYMLNAVDKTIQNEDEFIALNAPPLATALIVNMASHIQKYLVVIIDLSIKILLNCKIPSFKQSLITIFARLVLISPAEVVSHLLSRGVLDSVLNQWTKFHGDIQSRLDTNISTIALGKLMCLNDERLAKVMVDGTLIVPPQLKKTRSASRNLFMTGGAVPEKWTITPFYQKATMVILETYEMEMVDQEHNLKDIQKKLLKEQSGENNEDGEDQDEQYDDDDEDYDDEDDDFDVDNAEFEPAEDYAHYMDDDEDLFDFGDDLDALDKDDPYYNINLVDCIKEIFTTLNNSNPNLFNDQILPIIKKQTPGLLH